MSWVRYDELFYSSPAVMEAVGGYGIDGLAAIGLHVLLSTWSADYAVPKLEPVFIKHHARPTRQGMKLAAILEKAGLLTPVEGGWVLAQVDIGPPDVPPRTRIPEQIRSAVFTRDGFACLHCGSEDDLTLDHKHPWSKGGRDDVDNLQTLCRPCNSRKGVRV